LLPPSLLLCAREPQTRTRLISLPRVRYEPNPFGYFCPNPRTGLWRNQSCCVLSSSVEGRRSRRLERRALGIHRLWFTFTLRHVQTEQPDEEHVLSRVHRVIGLPKRWLMGRYQGAELAEHLDGYLNKFTFRFNRRTPPQRRRPVAGDPGSPPQRRRPVAGDPGSLRMTATTMLRTSDSGH